MFFKIGVLKKFAIFTGKRQCWSLFLIKLQAFMKKRRQHRCFPVNIANFLKAVFYRTAPVYVSETSHDNVKVRGKV